MRTIAIVNEKGGVGKTTLTVSLGAAMALAGRRVLVVDLDPQGSLTRGLLGTWATDNLDPRATVEAAFGEDVLPLGVVARETGFAGVSLAPGSRGLKRLERMEPAEYGRLELALRDWLEEGTPGNRSTSSRGLVEYDRVLIDCPPRLEFLARAAMVAADWVLVPLQAEDYGAQGVQFVLREVEAVQAGLNPGLRRLGLVRTMFQARSAIHVAFSEMLRAEYGGLLFEAVVPHAAVFREALAARTPLGFFRRCVASRAVLAVMEEVEGRMAGEGEGRRAA